MGDANGIQLEASNCTHRAARRAIYSVNLNDNQIADEGARANHCLVVVPLGEGDPLGGDEGEGD